MVGDLTAYLSVDKSGYDQGLRSARQDLRGLAGDAQTAATQAESRTSRIAHAVGSAASAAIKTAATVFAAGATAVTGLIISAGKAGIAYNGMQQASRAALTTILGGAEAANAQMDKLDEFARNSPFAKQVFISAQQQLLGFGVAADKVLPTLDAIQNAVAAVGGSNQEIAEIADVLAKIQGTGKITAETLNQLGYRGIDAAKMIGQAMGLTADEVRTKITKGTLDAGQAFDALVAGMQTSFGGAAANVKETWLGATDRIKGAWRDIGSAIAEPFVAHAGGGMAIEWVNKFADLMRAVQKQIPAVMDVLQLRLGGLFGRITPMLERAKAAVDRFDASRLNAQLDKLSGYAPLIAGVSTALFTLGTKSLPVIGPLVGAVNPLVAGLVALVATSPELRKVGGDFLQSLAPLLPVARDLAKTVADVLVHAIEKLGPAAGKVLQAVAPLAVTLGGTLAKALEAVLKVGGPVVDVVAKAAAMFAKLPGPVQAAVTALIALKVLDLGTVFSRFGRDAEGASRGVTGALRTAGESVVGFGQTARVNMRLAGDEVGGMQRTLGGLSAAAQSYMPATSAAVTGAMGRIRGAFAEAKRDARFDVAETFSTSVRDLPKAVGDASGLLHGFGQTVREVGSGAMSALRKAGSGLVSFLGGPWGVALAGGAIAVGVLSSAMQASQARIKGWAAALNEGGTAAAAARKEMEQAPSAWERFGFALSHGGQSMGVIGTQTREAKKAAEEYRASLDPLQRAQFDITYWTNEYAAATEGGNTTSLRAREASESLQAARQRQAQIERDVATATKTATDALAEQVNQALAAANADLGLRQARLAVKQAQEQYNQVLANGKATADERAAAEMQLESAYQQVAQMADQKARADNATLGPAEQNVLAAQAQLKALEELAAEMGGHVPAEVQKLIDSLRKSAGQANATAAQMQDLGIAVKQIPNSKSVIIDAPTADQKKRLEDLGYTVKEIPGTKQVIVTADTSQANAALNTLIGRNYAINVRANMPDIPGVQRFGAATGGALIGGRFHRFDVGGAVTGPGGPTADLIAALGPDRNARYRLSDGEHIWTDAEVRAAGGHAAVGALRKAVLAGGHRAATVPSPAAVRTPAPAAAPAATAVMDRPQGSVPILQIDNYHEAPNSSPQANAEALAWMARTRRD